MSKRVSAVIVTFQEDLKDEDAAQFAVAMSLLRGVISVEPVHPEFFNDQATTARLRKRVYEAVAEAFDPKKPQKGT